MAVTENTTEYGTVKVTKRTGTSPAQVSPAAPEGTPTTVDVDETSVTLDEVILDPEAENAVQTEGGEGSLDLPIHALDAEVPFGGTAPASE